MKSKTCLQNHDRTAGATVSPEQMFLDFHQSSSCQAGGLKGSQSSVVGVEVVKDHQSSAVKMEMDEGAYPW